MIDQSASLPSTSCLGVAGAMVTVFRFVGAAAGTAMTGALVYSLLPGLDLRALWESARGGVPGQHRWNEHRRHPDADQRIAQARATPATRACRTHQLADRHRAKPQMYGKIGRAFDCGVIAGIGVGIHAFQEIVERRCSTRDPSANGNVEQIRPLKSQ